MTTTAKKKQEPLPTKISSHEVPVPFVPDFKWSSSRITFTADSYWQWVQDALPIVKSLMPMTQEQAKKSGHMIGDKVFYLRPLPIWHYQALNIGFFYFGTPRPARCGLPVYRGETESTVYFDDVITIPVLADQKDMSPWMSLTPNEILTLRGSIRRAKNDTAIAGLGLGWVARKVLERKQVKKLTVYEKCQDIIDYFGKSLVEDFGDRVSIVCCDAYEADWMKHDVALWDIWQTYGGAAWDRKYQAIRDQMRKSNKVCVGWGEGVTK